MNVQTALANCGIPASMGTWREGLEQSEPPEQYIVYTSMTVPSAHHDDHVAAYDTFAYINLWSKRAPSSAVIAVRAAMGNAGWAMIEERADYDDKSNLFLVAWTWTTREEV